MNIESSNLSHAEYFHLNGSLSAERTEQALNELQEAQALCVREYAPYAQEALSGFVSEDFMCTQIKALQTLAKTLRGDNRQALQKIIASMQDDIVMQVNRSEYASEQLSNIIRTIYK